MARRRPQPRARRRVKVEQTAELTHAVLALIAFAHHPALAGPQQPGERRASKVDDEIPAPGRDGGVEGQPVCRAAPLLYNGKPLETGHGFEQRGRQRSRRDAESRRRVAFD